MQKKVMKSRIFTIVIVLGILFQSCSSASNIITLKNGSQIDKRLVGNFTGSETGQQYKDVTKSWDALRMDDGKFIIDFNADGEKFRESGTWLIKDGKYYETHNDGKTDVYNYEVLDNDHVKFTMLHTDLQKFNIENYTFVDTRKPYNEAPKTAYKNEKSDEAPIKDAIVVKSVKEEYEYIRKNCAGCVFQSQSLIEKGGKHYDALRVKMQDGTEKTYYFDINSFYGKW